MLCTKNLDRHDVVCESPPSHRPLKYFCTCCDRTLLPSFLRWPFRNEAEHDQFPGCTGHQNLSQGVLLVTPPFSIPAGSASLQGSSHFSLSLLLRTWLRTSTHLQICRAPMLEPKSLWRLGRSTTANTIASLFNARAPVIARGDHVQGS